MKIGTAIVISLVLCMTVAPLASAATSGSVELPQDSVASIWDYIYYGVYLAHWGVDVVIGTACSVAC